MSSSPTSSSTDSRAPTIEASIWLLQALATVFLGLRIYCKLSRRKSLWWDDYLLLISWAFLLASAIFSTINSRAFGFGGHFDQVPLATLETLIILSLCAGATSVVSSVASKTSFALTLLRISDGWLRVALPVVIVLMNVLMPLSALFMFVNCNPPAKNWKPYLPGTCWDPEVTIVYGIVIGAFSAACDFTLALVPWKILMKFHMYRREKIGVALAMSMGVFVGAAAVVKCAMLPLLGSPDFTYDGAPFVIWGFAECALTIIAASIPALRVLLADARGGHPERRLPTLVENISHTDSSDHGSSQAAVASDAERSRSANRGNWKLGMVAGAQSPGSTNTTTTV